MKVSVVHRIRSLYNTIIGSYNIVILQWFSKIPERLNYKLSAGNASRNAKSGCTHVALPINMEFKVYYNVSSGYFGQRPAKKENNVELTCLYGTSN